MDRESWHAAVHGVAKSWTWLSNWTELEMWKRSISGCLMSRPQIKKNHHFELSSFSLQQQWTIPWSDRDEKGCIQQPANQLSGWTKKNSKALPKVKICTKKGHGQCLDVCCWSDPLQLSESQWNHYIWEVCSANWWDTPKIAMPEASIGQHGGPNSSPQ